MSVLTPVDVIAGMPLGSVSPVERAKEGAGRTGDPWSALEDVMVPVLAAPPLAVSFSGGRDSSLLLAVAASAAERYGLAPPIAITMRFRSAAGTEESDWQHLIVRSLGIVDWRIINLTDELDYLGPLSTPSLLQDGLRFPPNAHSIVPVSRALGGGTIVIGVGGDELLAAWRWRHRSAALRRPLRNGVLRGPRAAAVLAFGAAPTPVRRWVFQRRTSKELRAGNDGFGWLTPAGRRAVLAGLVDGENQPVHWADFIAWTAQRRATIEVKATVSRLAQVEGVDAFAPLLEPRVLAALATARNGRGWSNRTEAMIDIVGNRLPREILTRRSKASFVNAFWGPRSREFVRNWNGSGVDPELVDIEGLRKEWCSEQPDFRSTLLLQSAWLSGQDT
jgi:hypothetical protein